jgi:hypothetical protein
VRSCFLAVCLAHLAFHTAEADEPLIANGGFENGLTGWSQFWSREPGGSAILETNVVRSGAGAVRIDHTGGRDWSFPQEKRLNVKPGDLFDLSASLRLDGQGSVTLGVILYDADGNAMSWTLGGRTMEQTDSWRTLTSRFIIPPGGATIMPRLCGDRPATVWMDDFVLKKTGSLSQLQKPNLPATVSMHSAWGSVEFNTNDGGLTIVDTRIDRTYRSTGAASYVVLDAHASPGQITFQLLTSDDVLTVNGTIQLIADKAEVLITLTSSGPMLGELAFPRPFSTEAGDLLIMPVNEGISYPVEDDSLPSMRYHMYGGHGLCMGFWGATDLQGGLMAIVETPDDAAVRVDRWDGNRGRLGLAPSWLPQKTEFGDERRIRFVMLEDGGYVAMCKRYREYAKSIDRFKTLAEKRAANPYVDRLIGAVNVWCWDKDPVGICHELLDLGIARILYSRRATADQVRAMDAINVLPSRYDIFQDVMNPENFPSLFGRHADWPTEAWPDDVVLRQDGDWEKGWRVRGKNDQWFPCGVLCDLRAVDYARKRIPAELATHPYRSRFIDTTTASPWRECYHPDHPMTRTDSRKAKMELLQYVSDECGLVTGSETGHDAAVPVVHYFEGMMSLGPYRIPDAGRRMQEIVEEVPERVAKFQTGHYYRLPLWELVYHDCVVAYWYWGDYNNKLPKLWDRRDLLNALYGTPPMFMFTRKYLQANKDRFVQSYQTTAPVARATGYSEMLSHEWLTADHRVQRTKFANGVTVTVNFGATPFTTTDGVFVKPLGSRVEGDFQE